MFENLQNFESAKYQFFAQYFYKKTTYELTTNEFSRIAVFIAFTLTDRQDILGFLDRTITKEAVYSNVLSKLGPNINFDEETTEVLRLIQIVALRSLMVTALKDNALNVMNETFDQQTKLKVIEYLESGDTIDKHVQGVEETLKNFKSTITGQKSYYTREEAMEYLVMKSTTFNKFRKYAGIASAGRNGTYTLEELHLIKEAQRK